MYIIARRLIVRHADAGLGLLAQGVQYGSALLLLPFVLTRLNPAEVGVWYIFVTIQGLAMVADFGFQPTFARSFAAAYSGVSDLQREGLEVHEGRGAPNTLLIRTVLASARRLYLVVAVIVAMLLFSLGLIYVSAIASEQIDGLRDVQIAWMLFASGTALTLYFLWISPVFIGSDRMTRHYLYLIANRGGFAVVGLAALLLGGGLVALAAASFVAPLLARLLAGLMLRPILAHLPAEDVPREALRATLKAVWPNAARMGLVMVGAFLILRGNVLVVMSFAGLTVGASYAVSLQILTVLVMMAQVPTQVVQPRMVQARVRGDLAAVWRLYLTRSAVFAVLALPGLLAIVLLGPWLLDLIGSSIELLSPMLLLLLGIVMVLEGNHSNAAHAIATDNRIPFVRASLLSGFAVVSLSTLAAWLGWGVIGVILVQGGVQLAYSNWKWPLLLWQQLHPGKDRA